MAEQQNESRKAPKLSKRPREKALPRRRPGSNNGNSAGPANRFTGDRGIGIPNPSVTTPQFRPVQNMEKVRGTQNRLGGLVKKEPVSTQQRSVLGRQAPPQKKPAEKSETDTFVIPDLHLPYRFGTFTYSEIDIKPLRIFYGKNDNEIGFSQPDLQKVASIIQSYNKLILDPKFKVNVFMVGPFADPSGQFVLYNSIPIVALSQYHKPDRAYHEGAHAIFYYLQNSTGASVNKLTGTQFIEHITDIFLKLKEIKIKSGRTADRIVDPVEWDPNGKLETGNNPDEFFASAVRAYHVNKPALIRTFTKNSTKNNIVENQGKQLIILLEALFKGGKITGLGKITDIDKVTDEINQMSEPIKLEDGLKRGVSANQILQRLFFPESRTEKRQFKDPFD